MQLENLTLFVEINESNYIFAAVQYDDNENINIVEKIISQNDGIIKNKFTNINDASKIIKKNIELIENKLNYIFKDVTIIVENFDNTCVNISGFKKLNGSQILKENISYILNSLKLIVTENNTKKNILHIFNSKSVLDGVDVENLPIGLFGDFYSHELTFFLIINNDLKNLKQIFNKSNLDVKKVFLKEFIEGVDLIKKNNEKDFFKIKINKETSNISLFDNGSFKYSENFKFGTNIIYRDIIKICSIESEVIENFLLNDYEEEKKYGEQEFIEEKYFLKGNYRKIRKKLISDIINARIDEITNIIWNKNINLKLFQQQNSKIYFTIQDNLISHNFKNNFKYFFSRKVNSDLNFINNLDIDSSIIQSTGLSLYGWDKEAIPIIQTKNSLITRFFKSVFG